MNEKTKKSIENFIEFEYKNNLLKNQDLSKCIRTNVLITKYFRQKLAHIKHDDIVEKRKFFFAFRKKYLNTFTNHKKKLTNILYKYPKYTPIQKFRELYTENDWKNINGDDLIKYLALEHKTSLSFNDLLIIRNIIRIVISQYKSKKGTK